MAIRPNQRITMADVARRAGVTKTTVSRVLNNKGEISESTREKVLEAMETLGYRPSRLAQGLATDRTFLLGLILPSIASEFFTEIARGAEETAWQNGYKIVLCNTEADWDREEGMYRFLEDLQADGVIVCSPRLPNYRLMPLIAQNPNAVIINSKFEVAAHLAGSVQTNDRNGTVEAVNHLLRSGRDNLVYFAGPSDSRSNRERQQGFNDALGAAGIEPISVVEANPANLIGGYHEAKNLLSANRQINGIVCFNDLVAAGVMRVCFELGIRVPEDVAIIGCDDILLASLMHPSLTTLASPKHEIGAIATQLLLERIRGKYDQEPVFVSQTLILRESAP
jgi:DNA-binding LacI/PurR family transcriptional regulator